MANKFEITDLVRKLEALQLQVSRVQRVDGGYYRCNLVGLCSLLADTSQDEEPPLNPETLRVTFTKEQMPFHHWRRIERVFRRPTGMDAKNWETMTGSDFEEHLATLAPPDTPRPAPATHIVSSRAEQRTEVGRDLFRIDLGPPSQMESMDIYLHVEILPVFSSCQRYQLGFSGFRIDVEFSSAAMAFNHALDRWTVDRKTQNPGRGGWSIEYNRQKHEPGWSIAADDRVRPLLGVLDLDQPLGQVVDAPEGSSLTATAVIQSINANVVYVGPEEHRPSEPALEFISQVMKITATEAKSGFSKLVLAEQVLAVKAASLKKVPR